MITRSVSFLLVASLLLAGCAATSAESSGQSPRPESSSAEQAATSCPYPHGGTCLGDLEGGTYTTKTFQPTLSYSVAEPGWVNEEDLSGNFLIFRDSDPQTGPIGGSYVGVYRDVRAAAQNCEEEAEAGIGQKPAELAAWLGTLPGVIDSVPEPVTVGGLDGVAVDLRLDPAWTGSCPWSGGYPVTALIIGNGVSLLHHVLTGGISIRLYLLEFEDGNVAVEVTSVDEQASADEYRAAVEPLLASFEFEG